MNDNSIPLVSVIMITYNHENFISAAVNSILNQKCNFKFELIIANDSSPDNTDLIVRELMRQTSSIIYFKHDKNLGMMPNFIFALKKARGKYIAICEGDDYWTDSLKLQKQVSFLEANPDYNMTVGRYQLYYQNSGKFRNNNELFDIAKPLTLKNYIAFNFGHTSTFLFRNSQEYPQWLHSVFAGDQSLFIINAKDKKIKYFSDFFSVYRINDGGATSSVKAAQSFKNTKSFLGFINEYTGGKYNLLINNRLILNRFYYHFELTNNKLKRNAIRVPIMVLRWWGIHILTRFVKD